MKISDIKIFLLKALVVTLPFGWWSPLPIPYTSLTFLFIYCYLGFSFLTFSQSLSLSLFKRYAMPLIAIWLVMLVMTFVHHNKDAVAANSVLRQFIFFSVFFAFGLKDISRMASRGENLYGYFLVSVFGLVAAFFGGFSQDVGHTDRQTITGVNPNMVALYSACGFFVLLDRLLAGRRIATKIVTLALSLLGLIGLAVIIALTGSRTGVVILAAGITVYLSTWSRMTPRRLALVLPLAMASLVVVSAISASDVMSQRMTELDTDIRVTALWPTALEIVKQYPLFGAGLGYTEKEIIGKTGKYFALHNEYLKIATSAGLVGLFLFMLVFKRLLRNALVLRRVTGSGLQLALWSVVALYLIPGGGALEQPSIWVVFLILSGPPISRYSRPLRVGEGQIQGRADISR